MRERNPALEWAANGLREAIRQAEATAADNDDIAAGLKIADALIGEWVKDPMADREAMITAATAQQNR